MEEQTAKSSRTQNKKARVRVPSYVCKRLFCSNYSLRRHMRTHSGEKPHSCDICKKSFSQECALKQHKKSHSGMKQFSCSVCNMHFGYKHTFKKHMNKHSKKEVYCNKCQIYKLEGHKCVREDPKSTVCCTICEKSISRRHYPEHLKRHTGIRPFACSICKKSFFGKQTLERHQSTHTGMKKFKCDECEKTFAQQGSLKTHQNTIHLGLKPFSCDLCPEVGTNPRLANPNPNTGIIRK